MPEVPDVQIALHIAEKEGRRSIKVSGLLLCHSWSALNQQSVHFRPYDELMRLRKVKIEMEAASGANSQISSSSSASSSSSRSSITETVIEPPETASPTLANGSSRPEFALLKIKPRKMFYTSTHSNPLALCSFNVKRIGGFVFCTRSKSLTDKLVWKSDPVF